MGKPNGFMEYARRENTAEAPETRARHWKEFHTLLPRTERQTQGARCMACGVPFCQSGVTLGGAVTGCPLHNLIPEWNDLVYTGSFDAALRRLTKTNNFPEFTGRVCPALCEGACTCSLDGDAVTVRQNELGIIEDAWASGRIVPQPPKVLTGKRVAIVGSGPAGLAAAAQLRSRGHAVTVYEKSDRPGGLLMYGIPNMKLDKSVVARRIALMEAEGVEFVVNTDVGRDITADRLRAACDAVILCAGAGAPRTLDVPGADADGVSFAVDYLTRSTRALLEGRPNTEAQGKDVLVVGGGDTGADCVATAVRQGCRSVIQLGRRPCLPAVRAEDNPWPQWPRICRTDYGQAEAIALLGRDPKRYSATVRELRCDEHGALRAAVTVRLDEHLKEIPGSQEELPCGLLLIAGGFRGVEPYVAEAFGLTPDGAGRLPAPDYATPLPGVFAAGDARRGQSLVVWAIREGRDCAAQVDKYLMGYTNL